MKKERQAKIKELIEKYKIDTQDELIKRLKESGFSATQATMSRDIKELKLTKISDGKNSYYYVFPNSLSAENINKLNASLRAWLTEKKENAEPIEAEWLVFEFYQICTEIQNELWSGYIEQIHKDLETIARYFPEGFSNVYNVSISSEDQATHFGLGQIIACFFKKAAWQYPKFIPNLYLGKF